MAKPNILLQLDPDAQASVFDAVVAVDAGVEHLLQYRGVTPEQVTGLVHGTIFTRGPADLKHTAIFIGGSNVAAGEALLEKVRKTFFGPMRVSVMLDSNGANTTAAAAVLAAEKHVPLAGATALVLGGTGAVGQRVARLLVRGGAQVRLTSRQQERAAEAVDVINRKLGTANVTAVGISSNDDLTRALEGAAIVVAAGAAGVQLLPESERTAAKSLRVAIDLNAVPPLGIEGVEVTDKAQERDGVACYGALGVGGKKMKIHTAALRRLFESNDAVLDAEEMLEIGRGLPG